MKNYIQKGENVTLAAPYDVLSGEGLQVGSIFGVASTDALETVEVEAVTEGVFDLTKVSAQAWTVGQKVYWDNSAKKCTTDSTAGMLIGVALAAADNPSSAGTVRLNGVAPATSEGPQAAIANLTDNSAGTANSTVQAMANIAGADAAAIVTDVNTNLLPAVRNNIADLVANQNAILAALRAAGIIASS